MGLYSGCRLDELASLKKSEIQTVEGVVFLHLEVKD
jgi:integrase